MSRVATSITRLARASSTFAAAPSPKVILSGIQPTGIPHLGNYLGALQNWVHLQNTSTPSDTLIYSVVGLHAITVPQNPAQLRQDRKDALATLLAIGIDPKRSILFLQEDVQEHAELTWLLGCITPLGKLNRMTAYKSKVGSSTASSDNERLGLFAYPVLQAADILAYKATHVPVGEDQRQHLELTRDLAQSFNHQFSSTVFPTPQDLITKAKRILSLRNPTEKMSKSAPNPKSRIILSDDAETITSKLRKSVTDSVEGPITYDPSTRPGVSNLLDILAACQPTPTFEPTALASQYQNHTMAELKMVVADAVESRIRPIREELVRIRADEGYLAEVADDGARRARKIASQTLTEVRNIMGLGRLS